MNNLVETYPSFLKASSILLDLHVKSILDQTELFDNRDPG